MHNINFTNEEIWDFLKNKMSKNGLAPKASIIKTHVEDYPNNKVEIIKMYYEDDVHNAIALAYKVGYLRAMKGRPFKIGEKKKGGHWEPVDPENLPKEGTRIRYARVCDAYLDYTAPIIKVGDTGRVSITKDGWFGIRLDKPRSSYDWLSFDVESIASCLDMWVEDDE